MSPPKSPEHNDDDYDSIPLQHKRPFGSGLHRRQPIAFVPASADTDLKSVDDASIPDRKPPHQDISDLYLSMVLPKDTTTAAATNRSHSAPPSAAPPSLSLSPSPSPAPSPSTAPPPHPAPTPSSPAPPSSSPAPAPPSACPVCHLPLASTASATPHAHTLAHQLSLPHSHPPSALDRTRMGLAYLRSRGWDPDARRGLGAAQQGIAYPLKPRVKEDRAGVGMTMMKRRRIGVSNGQGGKGEEVAAGGGGGKLLDAKKVRRMAKEEVRRAERLREELFGDGRVERYLGKGG